MSLFTVGKVVHEVESIESVILAGVSKTQTTDPKNSDPRVSRKLRPENSDPLLGVSKTQTQKTQTLGCLENSDPKNKTNLHRVNAASRLVYCSSIQWQPTCLLFVDTVALPKSAEKRKTAHSVGYVQCS